MNWTQLWSVDSSMTVRRRLFAVLFPLTVFSTQLLRIHGAISEIASSNFIVAPVVNGSEQMVLSAGDNVTLRCTGDRPVTWNYTQQGDSDTFKERVTVVSSRRRANDSSKYDSDLMLNNLMYLDTGNYECVYSDSFSNAHSVSSIPRYIYVFDPDHLFASENSRTHTIRLVENRRAVLSMCRTTHPEVRVTFKKQRQDNTAIRNLISFDPRIGVVIPSVTKDFDINTGLFLCVAALGNSSQSMPINVVYKSRTRERPEVKLTTDHVNNRTLTLDAVVFTCTAKVRRTTHVDVTWSYPQKELEESSANRIIETAGERRSSWQPIGQSSVTWNLRVNNFTLDDVGIYRCTVTDHDEKTSSSELYLRAFEKSFINLTTTESVPVEATADQRVFRLSVIVDAYPTPQLFWLKDGLRLNNTIESNGKYDGVTTAVLQIFNVHQSDAGLYTLTASNRDAYESLNMQLHVNYRPDVTLIEPVMDSPLYFYGNFYSLECHSTGFPEPQVRWMWQSSLSARCHLGDGGCFPREENWKPFDQSQNGAEVRPKGPCSKLKLKAKESGWYKCEATNKIGKDSKFSFFNVTDDKWSFIALNTSNDTSPLPNILHQQQHSPHHLEVVLSVSVVLGAVVCFLIVVIGFLCRRSRSKFSAFHLEELLRSSTNSKYNPDLPLDEQTDVLPYDAQWEFPKDRLKFDVVIGKGAFGTVYRARAFGISGSESVTTVAVKTVRDSCKMEQLKALVSELKVLIHLGQHVNILNALGAVTQDIKRGSLYVIMEYCHFGCLRDYLIKQRYHFAGAFNNCFGSSAWFNEEDVTDEVGYLKATKSSSDCEVMSYQPEHPLTSKDLVCYAFQIARGLEYLHSKKYIHRDLAARNILLAEGNVVKICDFGLAKDCYKYNEYHKKSSTPVPIKWMAIESLTYNLYTAKSDIWSYGVVLWELFTVGGNPYPTQKMDKTFVDLLNTGFRLDRPHLAEDIVYDTMISCWQVEPSDRPTASDLVEVFGGMLEAAVKQHYIDLKVHSIDYLRMNSKSGCLESSGYSNVDDGRWKRESFAGNHHPLTRPKLASFESGFASIAKLDDLDHCEYLPPSIDKYCTDAAAFSRQMLDFLDQGPDPEYENAEMSLLEPPRISNNDRMFVQDIDAGGRSVSVDLSSGISDTVFDDPESYSPPHSRAVDPLISAYFF